MMALTEHAPPLLNSLISKLEHLLQTSLGHESSSRTVLKIINKAKEVTEKFQR